MQTHIFNSQIPVSFREDGFLNATAISAHFGKLPKDYLKTEQTQEYIGALTEFLSNRTKILIKQNQIVTVKGGAPETGGGTWLHPKLAVHFARWLDAKFAVWCDMKIEEILGINQAQPDTRISPEQKQAIREAVQDRHHRTGETHQGVYKKLHSLLRVNSYHEIQARDFQTALDFLASIPNAPATPKAESDPKPQAEYINGRRVKYAANINFKQFDDQPEAYLITVQEGKVIDCQSFRPTSATLELDK